MSRKKKTRTDPDRLQARTEILSSEGFAEGPNGELYFSAIAQFFDVPNDRLMVFRRGAFAKTIAERANQGRVSIYDWHHKSLGATVGKVVRAEERDIGLWYRGMISAAEPKIQTKIREGLFLQNSIEIKHVKTGVTRARYGQLPDAIRHAFQDGRLYYDERLVAEVDEEGYVEALEMLEVVWDGIGLLSKSAQDRDAIISVSAVPFQALPVANSLGGFDRSAAESRILAASTEEDGSVNWARVRSAYLAEGPVIGGRPTFRGLIADVDDAGRVCVRPEAFREALQEVRAFDPSFECYELAARTVGRYEQLAGNSTPLDFSGGAVIEHLETGAGDDIGDGPPGNRPAPLSPHVVATKDAPDDWTEAANRELQMLQLDILRLEAQGVTKHVPASAGAEFSRSSAKRYPPRQTEGRGTRRKG